VKFYLDEDLSPRIAEWLRKRGIDAVSVFEVGNVQISDREQLAYAAREGRCLVTRNVRHFVVLSQEAVRRQEPHAGIILCPASIRGFEIRAIAAALIRVVKRFPEGLGGYDVLYL
jgi:predicted nuclease of predicted toxin-antitoxin system